MKRLILVLAASALVALAPVAAAHAVVLHSNPYDPNSTTMYSSWFEVPNAGGALHFQSFTDYRWDGTSTITDFHWWGVHRPNETFLEGFDFQIWSNNPADDQPDALLYSEFVVGDAGATFVESNATNGFDVYAYGIDLSTPFQPVSPGDYWFSVVAYGDNWFWAQGADVDFNADWQNAEIGTPVESWLHPREGVDFAFQVTGTGDPIPEPATLSLLGLGLAGAALSRRRRSKGR